MIDMFYLNGKAYAIVDGKYLTIDEDGNAKEIKRSEYYKAYRKRRILAIYKVALASDNDFTIASDKDEIDDNIKDNERE